MPGTSTVTSFWGGIGRQFDLASDYSAGVQGRASGRLLADSDVPTCASPAIGVGVLAWGKEIRAHGAPVAAWGPFLRDPVAGTWGVQLHSEIDRMLIETF